MTCTAPEGDDPAAALHAALYADLKAAYSAAMDEAEAEMFGDLKNWTPTGFIQSAETEERP